MSMLQLLCDCSTLYDSISINNFVFYYTNTISSKVPVFLGRPSKNFTHFSRKRRHQPTHLETSVVSSDQFREKLFRFNSVVDPAYHLQRLNLLSNNSVSGSSDIERPRDLQPQKALLHLLEP